MGYHRNILLSQYTTFRIGGPAAILAEAADADAVLAALERARSEGLPIALLGHGSNVLASDGPVERLVIVFRDERPPQLRAERLIASGGSSLAALVRFAGDAGLAGLADLAGIPGTVGGAIAGNAGAYGTAIGDRLESLLITDGDGRVRECPAAEIGFGYRTSGLRESGEIVLEARFRLAPAASEELARRAEERLADRRAKHPDWRSVCTAGSFFKNPIDERGEKVAAGRLLEEAGCKGLARGNARVWPQHANIVVAESGATAADVVALTREMQARVTALSGVELEPEVRTLF